MIETEPTLLEQLREALDADDSSRLSTLLGGARPADIAEAFRQLSDSQRSTLFFAMPPRSMAEVMILLDEAARNEVVEDLDPEQLSEIVSVLTPDDAADLLNELPEAESQQILETMPDEKSEKIGELLEYDESSAGGIMTPDVVAVPADATVADAVEYIRRASTQEDLNEVFIVDEDNRLVGTVPLRRLVTSRPDTRLSRICQRDPVSVRAEDDQETVLHVIRKYDVPSAAVVDDDDHLLGFITHDDLQDVAEEEAAEDLLRMAGTDATELESHSTFRAARIRLIWLVPCMFGMLLSATVLRLSEPKFDVALFAALVLFVPMIGATGGNSGVQIATVIVRAFAAGDTAATRLSRTIRREGGIAVLMAVTLGVCAYAAVSLFFPFFQRFGPESVHLSDPANVALAVGIAMFSAILVAAVLGIALPFSFRRLGVDPAIASGPLVTTVNDVVSVSIYMVVALLIAHS